MYEKLKLWCKTPEDEQQGPPAYVSMLTGGVAKSVATVATYPYQVIKSRLQQQRGKYRGMVDCVLKITRQEGIMGYFRGIVPNALKVAPQAALTFVLYEEAMKLLAVTSPENT